MRSGSSVGTCTRCVHVFARFGADLHAQSVLIDKFSASERSRRFVKSELLLLLLVGWVGNKKAVVTATSFRFLMVQMDT